MAGRILGGGRVQCDALAHVVLKAIFQLMFDPLMLWMTSSLTVSRLLLCESPSLRQVSRQGNNWPAVSNLLCVGRISARTSVRRIPNVQNVHKPTKR